MSDATRPSFEIYKEKLLKNSDIPLLCTSEKYYDTYMNGLSSDIKENIFSDIVTHLELIKKEYVREDILYLVDPSEMLLRHKPLESVINKIYRHNVMRRRSQTDIDINLKNFHLHIDDIFRTRLVCKYMDGPQYVCEKLHQYCKDKEIESEYRDVTTSLGYHAWHFYYKQPIADFAAMGQASVSVEIQVTTQLAEVISLLTHGHYEDARLGEKPENGWRWRVNSKQFRPYYIAHGLHLLEGMILEFRDTVINQANNNVATKDGNSSNDQ